MSHGRGGLRSTAARRARSRRSSSRRHGKQSSASFLPHPVFFPIVQPPARALVSALLHRSQQLRQLFASVFELETQHRVERRRCLVTGELPAGEKALGQRPRRGVIALLPDVVQHVRADDAWKSSDDFDGDRGSSRVEGVAVQQREHARVLGEGSVARELPAEVLDVATQQHLVSRSERQDLVRAQLNPGVFVRGA